MKKHTLSHRFALRYAVYWVMCGGSYWWLLWWRGGWRVRLTGQSCPASRPPARHPPHPLHSSPIERQIPQFPACWSVPIPPGLPTGLPFNLPATPGPDRKQSATTFLNWKFNQIILYFCCMFNYFFPGRKKTIGVSKCLLAQPPFSVREWQQNFISRSPTFVRNLKLIHYSFTQKGFRQLDYTVLLLPV